MEELNSGDIVQCYWNLHRGQWSVRKQGRVVARLPSLTLLSATFHVQPAGNRKVRETGRKNVHAYVKGVYHDSTFMGIDITDPWQVTYNPYIHTTFILRSDGLPVYEARVVKLNSNRTVEALL
jgi:hypothetical protein